MLRRLGIRGKVLAALSVPVVVLFLLAGLVSWQAIQEVRSTRAVQDVLEALEQSRLLAQSLQEEIGPFSETLPQTSEERQNAIGQAGEHRFLGVERCESRCDRRPGGAHAGGRHRTRTQGRLIWCEPRVCE